MNDRGPYFDLDGEPITQTEWIALLGDEHAKRIAWTDLPGDVKVSTIWLGLDHNFGFTGPPLILIFGGPHNGWQVRYPNRVAALAGHDQAVELARAEEHSPQMSQSDPKRTEGEPHDRLTRICDKMTNTLRAHPEASDDVRCVVFLQDGERGGLVINGYDDDSDAVVDVLMHLRAILRANGKDLTIAPFPGRG